MTNSERATSGKSRGFFYPTDEHLVAEVKRFLSTRPNNCGATEPQIIRVLNATPFVEAKKETDQDVNATRDDKAFFTEMRRETMVKVIKKFHGEGYRPAHIAAALGIPYSTAWYYCNKLKKGVKTRKRRDSLWIMDPETPGKHIKKLRNPRDPRAIAAEKEIIRKAEEKRQRRKAKRAAIGGDPESWK